MPAAVRAVSVGSVFVAALFSPSLRGVESQRGVRDALDVANVCHVDRHVRLIFGRSFSSGFGYFDDDRVADYVLIHPARSVRIAKFVRRNSSVGIGVDREACALTDLNAADVRLIDVGLHPASSSGPERSRKVWVPETMRRRSARRRTAGPRRFRRSRQDLLVCGRFVSDCRSAAADCWT